jgi:hypothetical protein
MSAVCSTTPMLQAWLSSPCIKGLLQGPQQGEGAAAVQRGYPHVVQQRSLEGAQGLSARGAADLCGLQG